MFRAASIVIDHPTRTSRQTHPSRDLPSPFPRWPLHPSPPPNPVGSASGLAAPMTLATPGRD